VPLDGAKDIFRAALRSMAGLDRPGGGGSRSGVRREGLPAGVRPDSQDEASALSFPASDPPADGMTVAPEEPVTSPTEPTDEPGAGPVPEDTAVPATLEDGTTIELDHGAVVIAAITSCTNTSNPSVMMAAGLLAKNAVERGLQAKPWVKRSLAPGSKVVVDYYDRSGLTPYLEKLGFSLVGFGCTTCIGNSGPLLPGVSEAVAEGDLVVASVLSGNRNFEGRINPDCRMNFLASPPLVVTYALAGTMDIDVYAEPLGEDPDGTPVFLRDIWPSNEDVAEAVRDAVASDMYHSTYANVFEGDDRWRSLDVAEGRSFDWDPDSTYIRRPTFFDGLPAEPEEPEDIRDGRVLAFVGDSVTTDHISPAGVIRKDSPAGTWLLEHGVEQRAFNSYGSRRGNHEVMVRGTFANIRIRNKLVPEVEGGFTEHLPTGEQLSIYDAAVKYQEEGTPLLILAGKEYGSGSSRDWAAKGPRLQGVRAVLAESYERIHRSNLIGMGILPLQFKPGESAESLGLTGRETYTIEGVAAASSRVGGEVRVRADGTEFDADVRIDTPKETEYYRHGGILQYVLRQALARG
jgi:aconitate hydratase